MSYYINIQLFAVLAELKEMFLSLSLSLLTYVVVPEASHTNKQTVFCWLPQVIKLSKVGKKKKALDCHVS